MNSVFAIALITLRSAVRSKVVLVLLLVLFAVVIGLPLTVRGDGTLQGHVQILLRYTLGLSMFVLSMSTLWAGCAAISSEIKDRQIQMIRTKPVYAVQVWLGKWLGLLVLNFFLISLSFLSTYVALRWTTQPDRLDAEEQEQLHTEILVAQRSLKPREIDRSAEVVRRYEEARARGEIAPEATAAEVMPVMERIVRTQAYTVGPGSYLRWTFDLPTRPPADRPLVLRYRFSLSVMDVEPIRGTWTIGALNSPHRMLANIEEPPQAWQTLSIPVDLIEPNGTLTVEFANVHDQPITVVFDPDTGLQLLVYEGGFVANYLRAALLILFHLAFLASIGITAGAYFSMPVAVLTSLYALILVNAGRFVGQVAQRGFDLSVGAGNKPGIGAHLFETLIRVLYHGLDVVVRPVYAANPLDFVATGEWISWGSVGYMFLIKVLLYGGILAALGAWHLAHKEVALPA